MRGMKPRIIIYIANTMVPLKYIDQLRIMITLYIYHNSS